MKENELIESLKIKLEEAKKILNFSSKDFKFKSWQASTLTLLRALPSIYKFDVNNFKKLIFEDTKYHRGNKFFSSGHDAKYAKDMNSAIAILKKITSMEIPLPGKKVIKNTKKPAAVKKTGPVKKSSKAVKPKTAEKIKVTKSSSKPKKKTGKTSGAVKTSSRKTGTKSSKKPKK